MGLCRGKQTSERSSRQQAGEAKWSLRPELRPFDDTFTHLSPGDKEEFSQRDVHDLTQGEAFGPTVRGC